MKPLATAAGQTPADKLDARRQGFLDNLKAASAADFDKTYIDQQVAAHGEALTLMQGSADGGPDAGLRPEAAAAAPKIPTPPDKAKATPAALKTKGPGHKSAHPTSWAAGAGGQPRTGA